MQRATDDLDVLASGRVIVLKQIGCLPALEPTLYLLGSKIAIPLAGPAGVSNRQRA